jgi:hypothetical protein
MTIDELLAHHSIRDTMARYTLAGDRLREEEFVMVFTEDAVLASDGVGPSDSFRFEGKDAIREWIARWRHPAPLAASSQRATFVRHHLSTSLIELVGPSAAKARTYWVAYTDIGPDHCGYYLDTFRNTAERWLIAERKVRLDWRSPKSLFSSAIQDTAEPPR